MTEIREMTQEEMIDIITEQNKTAQEWGYLDWTHFEVAKWETQTGLMQYGGNFCHHLGLALACADWENARKIMRYWQAECEKHRLIFQCSVAKKRAEEGEMPNADSLIEPI